MHEPDFDSAEARIRFLLTALSTRFSTPRPSTAARRRRGRKARRGALASLYDFENRGARFCLLTIVGQGSRVDAARYAFSLRDTAELDDADRAFTLTAAEIALINPNTESLPVSSAAAETPPSPRRSTAACQCCGTRRGPTETPGR